MGNRPEKKDKIMWKCSEKVENADGVGEL